MTPRYELEASYGDGYSTGSAIAEHHFNTWQDAKGPPFPWPKGTWDIGAFVENCLPMMRTVLGAKMAQDAYEAGINPNDVAIPRVFTNGVEEGYRTRLTELLRGFIQRRSMFRY